MSRLEKPTDFSALLEKYADSPLIPYSPWNADRERSNSGPSRHDLIRERLSNRFRSAYHDLSRTYALRESEIFTLAELGKFRVISTEDLNRFAYDGNKEYLEQDIQNLKKQGLILQREIEARNNPKFRVLSLTKDGKRFLQHQNRVPRTQFLSEELAQQATLLVTMGCGDACPYVPGLKKLDWPLPDPKGQLIEIVRNVRDEIRHRVADLATERNWL